MLLLEEDLSDPLTGNLKAKSRPQVSWYADLHGGQLEEYGGKVDRTSLSLWMNDRARRRLVSPPKTVRELTPALAKEVCTRDDNNFCVVAFYRSAHGKDAATRLLETAAQKYTDDPVTFYVVDRRALRAGCPLEDSEEDPAVAVFRTKRRKFETLEGGLNAKIEAVLSGSPLTSAMADDFAACFA